MKCIFSHLLKLIFFALCIDIQILNNTFEPLYLDNGFETRNAIS